MRRLIFGEGTYNEVFGDRFGKYDHVEAKKGKVKEVELRQANTRLMTIE